MKTILLILAIGFSFSTFAQKKLRAEVAKGYNEAGIAGPIDSSAYSYADWRGSMNSNQYKFGFNYKNYYSPNVPMWQYDRKEVDFTTLEYWDGGWYPLNQYSSETKNYNSTFECTTRTVLPYNYVYNYTYTTDGLISTISGGQIVSGTLTDTFTTVHTYDNMNRLISKVEYLSWINLHNIDSFEYDNTSLNVARFSRYSSTDGITYQLGLESNMNYSGNEIMSADVYQDTDSNPLTALEHKLRALYYWNGNALDSMEYYNVNGGVIASNPNNTISFTYNSSNLLESIIRTGEAFSIEYLTYDSDNFLIEWEEHRPSSTNSSYYLHSTNEWLFDATNSINQLDDISISIYPNPVSEELFIDSKNVESLKVYSLSGQLIKESMQENSISVAELESGIYYLEATIGNKQITQNFIKQ